MLRKIGTVLERLCSLLPKPVQAVIRKLVAKIGPLNGELD